MLREKNERGVGVKESKDQLSELAAVSSALEEDLIESYLWSMIGKPYIWGGQGPIGFDCSGLVVEMLKARGFVSARYDNTSHGLYETTKPGVVHGASCHDLAFFGRVGRITHVGYCIDSQHMIEAGGGGSKCTTPEAAAKVGAMVRLRPIYSRRDFKGIHRPRKTHFR